MNKAEAAEYLEIGIRTLERYMGQGRIAYTRQRGKTGEKVIFDQKELERFKEELYSPTHEGAIELGRQASPSNELKSEKNRSELATVGELLFEVSEGLSLILETLKEQNRTPSVPIASKPLLSLKEAQEFSGLSRKFLLESINQNKLKGQIISKSWRIKRKDLEEFIGKLF